MKIQVIAILASLASVGLAPAGAADGPEAASSSPAKNTVQPAQAKKTDGDEKKEKVISIIAKKFEYIPSEIKLKKGEPVILEFTAQDFKHGFTVPDMLLKDGKPLRSDLPKGETVRIRLVPEKAGKFPFRCDNFCGLRHEDMEGVLIVE